MATDSYRTVAQAIRHEGTKVKGSRFIATGAPLASAEAFKAMIAGLRTEFPEANHHCSAYRLGPAGDIFRFSDDGEPGGSAGRPILNQIDGRDLTDTVVIVTRIFGGTKLGVGGLIRAYGGAASEVLDRCGIREVVPTRRFLVTLPYELSGVLDGFLLAEGVVPDASRYGERIEVRLEIPDTLADGFLDRLRDRTAGKALITPAD